MRSTFLFVTLYICSLVNADAQTDFRSVRWGMSIEDVKKLENTPLTSEEKNLSGSKNGTIYYDGMQLKYENITVAERKAEVRYNFKNGKLVEIIVVFKPDLFISYQENVTDVIDKFSLLYSSLQKRNFKFESFQCGSHGYNLDGYDDPGNKKIKSMNSFKTIEILNLLQKMVNEKKYNSVFFRCTNDRSRALINFFTENYEYRNLTPVIIYFTPSFKIEEEIKGSDF